MRQTYRCQNGTRVVRLHSWARSARKSRGSPEIAYGRAFWLKGRIYLKLVVHRAWWKVSIALAMGALTLLPMPSRATDKLAQQLPGQRPNILVVVTDDQRVGTMSAMPQTREWLRESGVDYRNGFVTTPACCPSRTTIFTGLYPHNHGVIQTASSQRPPQSATVQRALDENGYRTGVFGKYLTSWEIRTNPPHFDDWAIYRQSQFGYRGATWNVRGELQQIDEYGTTFITQEAVDFLQASPTEALQPWFLYLVPPAPHQPHLPEEKYEDAPVEKWRPSPSVARDGSTLERKPRYVQEGSIDKTKMRRIRRQQLRTLMSVDDMMTELRKTLEEQGQLDNTMIIFTSDNGYMWGEHARVGKNVPYTESVKVPFFIWTGSSLPRPPGEGKLVGTVDITPTILDVAGIEDDVIRDGRSIFDTDSSREKLLIEAWQGRSSRVPTWASLRGIGFQYTEYYLEDGQTMYREMYSLRQDPYEMNNLLPSRDPEVNTRAQRLAERLRAARTCSGSSCP